MLRIEIPCDGNASTITICQAGKERRSVARCRFRVAREARRGRAPMTSAADRQLRAMRKGDVEMACTDADMDKEAC
jgi:hypothetical protein